jgi:RES domain-containing protein
MVLAHGYTGILFPSQAHEGGTNVVVYSERLKDGNSVTVNDPDGRLPRDQSSWTR